jgi:hypothetical protein
MGKKTPSSTYKDKKWERKKHPLVTKVRNGKMKT